MADRPLLRFYDPAANVSEEDEELLTIAANPQHGEPISDPHRGKWGQVLTVPIGGTAGPIPANPQPGTVQLPDLGDEERDCTVILQPRTIPALGYLIATIYYTVGSLSLSKTVPLWSTVQHRVQLTARNVQVSILCANSSGTASTVQVNVACIPGHTILADFYAWAGIVAPITDAAGGTLATGPGVLGDLHVILTAVAAAGTPLWLMLFDTASAIVPANGTTPLRMGVSDTMEVVGDSDSFKMVVMPEVEWTSGLAGWLSSTADTFTAAAAGNQCRIDAVVGQ